MTGKLESRCLAVGPGWFVQDVICSAGPQDSSFGEQHATVAIAAVLSGTFIYRTAQGSGLLPPGAVLLGNHGRCFECSHEHAAGDHCVSFHFTPDYWEEIATAVPGIRKTIFKLSHLPPMAGLLPVIAAIDAARQIDQKAMEELALDFAGSALRLASDDPRPVLRKPRAFDERRVTAAVRFLESTALDLDEKRLSLGALAKEVGMSRFHFLRTFRDLVGMTPHQYLLHLRMNKAATDLRVTDEPVTAIALSAGFNDLSTFSRRFRRLMGVSPAAYRRGERAFLLAERLQSSRKHPLLH